LTGSNAPQPPISTIADADTTSAPSDPQSQSQSQSQSQRHPNSLKQHRKPKNPYEKESKIALQKREEADRRRKDREEKIRDRKAMAKAKRPGTDGKRRLGRESKVLLGRVRRIVGAGG